MAHKKGVGSSKNGRDSNPKMLGVKAFGGTVVPAGSIIVTADRPYLSYLTVIDGSSQDPVFVMPQ